MTFRWESPIPDRVRPPNTLNTRYRRRRRRAASAIARLRCRAESVCLRLRLLFDAAVDSIYSCESQGYTAQDRD